MEFAINYVNNDFNTKYTFDNDIYLKYPGFRPNFEEFKNMPKLKNKILLHGIIPSSGSIFDEHLCDNMDYWTEVFKKNENRWVSLHFYYEDKFCPLDKAEEVCKSNIQKIRQKLPNIPIILENVPYQYKNYDWCFDPDVITYYCNKYDLGFLLDISHLFVYCKNNNLDVEKYLKKLPLDKLYEIHISGYYINENGKLDDAHLECFDKIYDMYKKVLSMTKSIKMTSLEYPVYNDIPVVIKRLNEISDDEIYKLQKKQLNKIKEIYNNHLYKNTK